MLIITNAMGVINTRSAYAGDAVIAYTPTSAMHKKNSIFSNEFSIFLFLLYIISIINTTNKGHI